MLMLDAFSSRLSRTPSRATCRSLQLLVIAAVMAPFSVLAQVTVTAEAMRAEGIDTQVVRLDEGPPQSTGTVLDALKNVPGATVDQDGKDLTLRQRQVM
jgi:hypothetical protein